MLESKTCVITGFTGMVGSHLADFLLDNTDWDIVGFCRWNDNYENVSHLSKRINENNRIRIINGDINDYPSVSLLLAESKPDYIFHLAAQSYPQTSFRAPIETLQTNIIGTANLLECVRQSNLSPIIHVCASSEVFGRVSSEYLPIDEEAPFHPASPYAISKVGTDLVGRYYAEAFGMNVMTTRMFTHTGPRRGDVFAESTFAKQIAMIESGKIPPVIKVGNLDSLRTWSDVRDAVRAYYMLVTKDPIPGSYYNIGGTHSCTVGEMLRHLISISTVEGIRVEEDPSRLRPIDADLQVPNVEKFNRHTGWRPEISFEKTMKDLLDYWREKIRRGSGCLVR